MSKQEVNVSYWKEKQENYIRNFKNCKIQEKL
jgi:hypothetical protein